MQAIKQMIASVGLPCAYNQFRKSEAPGHPPFICFYFTNSNNFIADGKVYQKIRELKIELYTDEKTPALEAAVESALDAAGLCYESAETGIESERMLMVTWTTEVALD